MRITVMGVPGAGKTTLSLALSSSLGLKYVSSGDLVRKYLTDPLTCEELSHGHMAPNETKVQELVRQAISGTNKYILDGFPRKYEQISTTGVCIDVVIVLDINVANALDRLMTRGRSDDQPSIISKRLELYTIHTYPLIEIYKASGIPVIRINADQERVAVWVEAISLLDILASAVAQE